MSFFLSNARLVILITIAFVLMGVKGFLNLKRESIPPVDFARAFITTIYPGSSPSEVEELITTKIENEIRSVEHLKDVNSVSQPGLSIITIRIDIDNADTTKVINELHQALQNVQGLPPEVLDPPKLTHINASSDRPILHLLISGPDNNRLRDQISWNLKTKLEKIPGISEITMGNYKKREFLILLSQEKMDQHYVSSADVVAALEQQKMDIPSGYLENNTQRNLVRVLAKPRMVQDLENIIIRSNFSGQKIFVKDIAEVIDSHEEETEKEYFYQSGKNKAYKLKPVTTLTIMKTVKADTVTLVSNIRKNLKKAKQTLNKEYEILTGFNEGKTTKRRLLSVINNSLTGLALIFIVFFLFLPSRTGCMVSLSLPLSVLGTFSLLPFMGVSFNVITMLAFVICIGMLVDNSVVIGEYYSRLISEKNISPRSAAFNSIHQFAKPITATVLTTVVAFLPMLVTTGVMGQFIRWIPIVVTVALLMSLFESFCLLPNRLQWWPQKKPSRYQKNILNTFSQIESFFEKFIRKIVTKKYISLGCIALLIILTSLVFQFHSRVDLFSPRNPDFYGAFIEPEPNTPLPLIDKQIKRIAKEAQTVFDGEKTIEWMSVKMNTESAEILIKIKKSALRKVDLKNTLNELRKIPKGDLKTLTFKAVAGGPPVGKPLSAAIQSNDRKEVRRFIDEIFPEIKKIPGLVNLKSNPDTDIGTEYKVQIDPDILIRLGLNFKSVGLALRTALEGHIITELTENNESFYIRVKHDEEKTSSFEHLKRIKIKEFSGRLIPLSEIAQIKEVPSEPHKKSYNFEPVVFLEGDINPKLTTSIKVNKEAKKIIEKKIKNYPSLSYKLVGEQETTKESLQSLINAAVLAVFAIFIILIVLFKSFIVSFLILTCIPLGLIGVIWSFLLHQRSLNFFALVGVVGLAGVVVNSAIILISFISKLKKEEPELSLSEIVIKASKRRFRPIMITNLTTMGGLLPTAYGIAGFEPLLMPMTLALFWGLFTATFLTLIWIPCALLTIEDGKKLLSSLLTKSYSSNNYRRSKTCHQ